MAILNAEYWEKDKVRLTIEDILCNVHHLFVDRFDYECYCSGHRAQDVFPYLTPNDRELIISGIPSDFWDETFNQETGHTF
jgi:hypothetical protein